MICQQNFNPASTLILWSIHLSFAKTSFINKNLVFISFFEHVTYTVSHGSDLSIRGKSISPCSDRSWIVEVTISQAICLNSPRMKIYFLNGEGFECCLLIPSMPCWYRERCNGDRGTILFLIHSSGASPHNQRDWKLSTLPSRTIAILRLECKVRNWYLSIPPSIANVIGCRNFWMG